jgi:DNA polymerase I-like protein with 3'-5' exonuclease and polymerase domains
VRPADLEVSVQRFCSRKRIKTGYTTDSDALARQTGHTVLERLLRHRDLAKLKSTADVNEFRRLQRGRRRVRLRTRTAGVD